MATLKDQSFDSIFALLRSGRPRQALRRILEPQTARLRKAYAWDANQAWYCVGNAHFVLGNYRDAIEAYRKAHKVDPSDAQSLWAIGNCYDAMKRPKLAERFFRRGLQVQGIENRDMAAMSVNLGNALFDQKRFVEAAAAYFPALRRRDQIGRKARLNFQRASELASQ